MTLERPLVTKARTAWRSGGGRRKIHDMFGLIRKVRRLAESLPVVLSGQPREDLQESLGSKNKARRTQLAIDAGAQVQADLGYCIVKATRNVHGESESRLDRAVKSVQYDSDSEIHSSSSLGSLHSGTAPAWRWIIGESECCELLTTSACSHVAGEHVMKLGGGYIYTECEENETVALGGPAHSG